MQGIQRQVEILDALSEAPESGVSITNLCLATGLPKGTVHRMLESLREHGIAIQEEDSKKWRLGPRVAFWAGKYLEGPTTLAPLRRFVGRLSQETQSFAYLTILDHGNLVCDAVERPERKTQFFVQLGSRIPVLFTAAAKALLACQPMETVRTLVEQAITENPGTRFETVTIESYLDELSEARRYGYAKCLEELEVGVSALGAPVINARGRSLASLSVVAPTAALVEEWDVTIKKLLLVPEEATMTLGRERENKAIGW